MNCPEKAKNSKACFFKEQDQNSPYILIVGWSMGSQKAIGTKITLLLFQISNKVTV